MNIRFDGACICELHVAECSRECGKIIRKNFNFSYCFKKSNALKTFLGCSFTSIFPD